jgi:hypothetical protein
MDLKARQRLVDGLLGDLRARMLAVAEEVPDHWQREEFEWLQAHLAQAMTSQRSELGLRRRSFNHTVREKRW